jgi:SAM-dependent methyltransferase
MLARLRQIATDDHRTPAFYESLDALVRALGPGERILSVGGGPMRQIPQFLNLNIEQFTNVDVVGDAHRLPFADNTLPAVFCEAVLEHVEDPNQAVAEMFRVLRPGGLALAVTPFLVAFHGYPSHFQNFTDKGHELLFTRAGFAIARSGPCVGPGYVLASLTAQTLDSFLPRPMAVPARWLWRPFALGLRQLDRWWVHHPNARMMCSTTYVFARKP